MSYSNQKHESLSSIIDERAVLAFGIILILIPLCLEAVGFRFTDRFMTAKDLLNQSPIGEVIRKQKTVRKRAESSGIFSPITPGDSIFVGDRVLTGKESSARITLSDGSILELGPESLIRIEPVRAVGLGGIKRKLKITLESGTVKAAVRSQSAPVVIENTKGEVILEATPPPPPTLNPSNSMTGGPSAPVPQFSSAELRLPNIESGAPAPVQQLIQEEDLKAKSEPEKKRGQPEKTDSEDRPILAKITLAVRPPAGEITFLPFPKNIVLSERYPIQDQRLRIEWRPVGYGMEGRYQVSLIENGNPKTVETKNEFIELPVPDTLGGKLEYRVSALLKTGEKIDSKQDSLQWRLPSPTLVTPADGERISESSLLGKSKKLLLSWKEMPACVRFRVEVTTATHGTPTNQVHETVENFIPVPLAGSNRWKWRVSCVFSEQTSVSSSMSDFVLEADPVEP